MYAMIIQGNLAPAQEFPLTYKGDKPFLGHGYILVVKDKPKTIRIDFSAANPLKAAEKDWSAGGHRGVISHSWLLVYRSSTDTGFRVI